MTNKLNLILLSLIATFLIMGSVIEQPKLENLPKLYTEISPAVVRVTGNYTREIFPGVTAEQVGNGSGFVIDKKKGLIVTADHNVEHLEDLKVVLSSGKVVPCTIKARDNKNDVAIIQVEPLLLEDLPELKFVEDSKLYVGEFVFAVGHPCGLKNLMTLGILGNTINYSKGLWCEFPGGFYITDMLVESGNSGSLVCNLKGEVIAMAVGRWGDLTVLVPAASIKNLIESIN